MDMNILTFIKKLLFVHKKLSQYLYIAQNQKNLWDEFSSKTAASSYNYEIFEVCDMSLRVKFC